MATPVDPDKQASINMGSIAGMRGSWRRPADFVARVYIPDLLAVASFYKDWAGYGGGVGNYLVYGEYHWTTRSSQALPALRVIRNKDLSKVEAFDPEKITSTSSTPGTTTPGATTRACTPESARRRPTTRAPSRLTRSSTRKASTAGSRRALRRPAHGGGAALPDARRLRLGPPAGQGARGNGPREARRGAGGPLLDARRVAARGIETLVLAERMEGWLDDLAANMQNDKRIHDNDKWSPSSWPKECSGRASTRPRAGRSPLGAHQGRSIENYQCVVPSTWNAGPRDAAGHRGPYEEALLGRRSRTPSSPRDPAHRPLVRPCMACGVHVVDVRRREIARVRVP